MEEKSTFDTLMEDDEFRERFTNASITLMLCETFLEEKSKGEGDGICASLIKNIMSGNSPIVTVDNSD